MRKRWIEDLVVDQIVKILMDDALLQQITDMLADVQSRESVTIPMLKQQLAETERGIDNLVDAIQQGLLTPSTKKRLDDLEKTKSNLEVAILQEEFERPLLTLEQVLFFLHRFRKIDVSKQEHRQRLIDSFVNTIYLYDDKIVFAFNYKDDTKTISLDEVSKELGSDLTSSSPPNKKHISCPHRKDSLLSGNMQYLVFAMR